jgi:hypothetical protein
VREADNLNAICERLSRKCGNLDVSQTPRFMKPEVSLLFSRELAIVSYAEPDESTSHLRILLLQIHINIIVPSTTKSFQWSPSLRFYYPKFTHFSCISCDLHVFTPHSPCHIMSQKVKVIKGG